MALTMLGMLVLAPAVGVWLAPLFDGFYGVFGIDPSIIPASLLANDMGGMTLALSVCKDPAIGAYNAFVTSSMMGCLISFTLPFSLGLVKREQHNSLFLGILCGIATIPVGCFVSGLVCGISLSSLLLSLLPLILLGLLVGLALAFLRRVCIRCFAVLGTLMKIISATGLALAIFTLLTGVEICPHFDSLENAALICVRACVTLSGALPLMALLTRLLHSPLGWLGGKVGINATSAATLLGTLVTNAVTFGVMDRMDRRGAVLNSAFAVSAAFALGSHLAFTMAYDPAYLAPMIVGKLISGVAAVALALLVTRGDAYRGAANTYTEVSYA
jgi:ethanolamine transporter